MGSRLWGVYFVLFVAIGLSLSGCQDPKSDVVVTQGGGPSMLESIVPADGTASVPVTTSVQLFFTRAMDPTSLTTTDGSSACGGSVSLSSDDFQTCIPMTGGSDSTTDKSFTFKPTAALVAGTRYKVRLTTKARSGSHHGMSADWASTQGFITVSTPTVATDTVAPTVMSVSPASGAVNVGRATPLTVTFSEPVDTKTLVTQSADGTCTGTFQISNDNFTYCAAMNAASTADSKTITVTPVKKPNNYMQIKTRVKAGVKDLAGNATAADWTSAQSWSVIGWQRIDGGLLDGLNYSNTASADAPVIRPALSRLFTAWSETTGGANQIRVRSMDLATKGWSWNDGATSTGINQLTTSTATNPDMVEFGGKLYVAWQELNGAVSQIRVKQYDGVNWVSVDGNNSFGINASSAFNADSPRFAIHNNQLHLTWAEFSGTKYQIRLAKWNGTTTPTAVTPPWAFLDGGGSSGLNYLISNNAYTPVIASWNTKLYLTWVEDNGVPIKQIRFAEWDGATSRIMRDGAVADGLNQTKTVHAWNPALRVAGNQLYLSWREDNGTGQLRLAQYDTGTAVMNLIDGGGPTGLNVNTTQFAGRVALVERLGQLYLGWQEQNGTAFQIRSAVRENNQRLMMDGAANTGLNFDPIRGAGIADMATIGESAYMIWVEDNGSGLQKIHVSELP